MVGSRLHRSLRRRDRIALQPATPPTLTPPGRLGPVGRDEVNHGVEPLFQATCAACDLREQQSAFSTARMASARLSGSAAVLISPDSRIRSSPWRMASCHRSNAAANAWRPRGSRSLSSPTSDPIGHPCLPSGSCCSATVASRQSRRPSMLSTSARSDVWRLKTCSTRSAMTAATRSSLLVAGRRGQAAGHGHLLPFGDCR